MIAKFIEISKISKISSPVIHAPTCRYAERRNVGFSGNFAYAVNGWFHVEVNSNTATETWPKSTRKIQ